MAGKYSYFFFKPDRVTILEGFTTKLTVWGVPTDNPKILENVTDRMAFVVDSGDSSIAIYQPDPSLVEVSGVTANTKPSSVVATPRSKDGTFPDIKACADCTVDQADLLIYAPDGNLYWVKPEQWQHAEKIPIDSPSLSCSVKPLLDNEAVVANIPEKADPSVSQEGRFHEGPGGARAEPITCFLLNLNSILLSYKPGALLRPMEQDPATRPSTNTDSQP
ncbi:hypothetical protein [Myxococcus qinghaiensis]|uniref:hypothetical protein n=1 Tax=Myxococcus qinghaiensis TaxID=2906758 RepID=UPI0020A70E68|nr:hypothetical protein [Myxococcus qinghaiensis]MCP3162686.1 hypothetical protein [Myxococcus qinghaiensis]